MVRSRTAPTLGPQVLGGRPAINPFLERVWPLGQARKFLPPMHKKRRPDISTIYRWSTKGLKGVVLETCQVGGTRCVSREAIARFFAQLSGLGTNTPIRSHTAQNRSQRRAENVLDRLGIG